MLLQCIHGILLTFRTDTDQSKFRLGVVFPILRTYTYVRAGVRRSISYTVIKITHSRGGGGGISDPVFS